MAGREGRMERWRQMNGVEAEALDVFLLFHQQKPVGKSVQ